MVELTRLDGSKLTVNAELIELIEATPDTVISLTTGRHLIVREPVSGVVRLVVEYKRLLSNPLAALTSAVGAEEASENG